MKTADTVKRAGGVAVLALILTPGLAIAQGGPSVEPVEERSASRLSSNAEAPADEKPTLRQDDVPEAQEAGDPVVLAVALPERWGLGEDEARNAIEGLLATLERAPGAAGRPLRVNLSFGTDYHVLSWLQAGQVDMAVVSLLGIHLLRRDGADLVELKEIPPAAGEWLTSFTPSLTIREGEDGSERQIQRPARAGFDSYLAEVWKAAETASDVPYPHPEAGQPILLSLDSHLTTGGFLVPVAEAYDFLKRKLTAAEAELRKYPDYDEADEAEQLEAKLRELRDSFWASFLGRACFRFASPPIAGRSSCSDFDPDNLTGRFVEVGIKASPGERRPPLADRSVLALGWDLPYEDFVVFRRTVSEALFAGGKGPVSPRFRSIAQSPYLPADLHELLGGRAPRPEAEEEIPPAFRPFLAPEPYVGSRVFGFKIDELFRLLERQRSPTAESRLAVVLPGGGVKAAYQSGLLDRLYGCGYLENFKSDLASERRGLDVKYVIGTSGGALVGYFVSRIAGSGPFNLREVLWAKDAPSPGSGAGDVCPSPMPREATASSPGPTPLDSQDIFSTTDLLRYLSFVAIYLIFALLLALAALHPTRWLTTNDSSPPVPTSSRPAVFFTIFGVLVATPLLVRWVNGHTTVEHLPEIEGLLYAVLVGVAMLMDQCLVLARFKGDPGAVAPAEPTTSPSRRYVPLVVAGGVGLGATLIARLVPSNAAALEENVSFEVAYVLLGGIVAALMLGGVARSWEGRRRELGLGVGAALFVIATPATIAVWRSVLEEDLLARLDRTPLFFLALVLIPVGILLARIARDGARTDAAWLNRVLGVITYLTERIAGIRSVRWIAAGAAPFVISLVIVDLTRPRASLFAGSGPVWHLESKIAAPAGGFFVCLAMILLLLGAFYWYSDRHPGYTIRDRERFTDGTMFLVLGVVGVVYSALLSLGWMWGKLYRCGWVSVDGPSLFELTIPFWVALALVSFVVSGLVIDWGCHVRDRTTGFGRWLVSSLRYLAGRHPNAGFVPRRFVRIALLAVGGLLWWNVILAPAFYGNRFSYEYLRKAEKAFVEQFPGNHRDDTTYPPLTANLLAPANALERDGTRYVLAVPQDEKCPTIAASPVSGSRWYLFGEVASSGTDAGAPTPEAKKLSGPEETCTEIVVGEERSPARERLLSYIFASGSVFPVFPAHRVRRGAEDPLEALVDGGYTNLVPVEAAGQVGVDRILIVNSSYPFPGGESSIVRFLRGAGGPLVGGLLRLPGFLYERSQQLDRRSRSDLFVASLSPPLDDDWPILTDFRASVVERMWRAAERDLDRRIGTVESWGPPRIEESFLLTPASDPANAAGGGR